MANSRICSISGCDKIHYAKGFCVRHYERLRSHGDPLGGRTPEGEPQRFYDDVVLKHEGKDCLIWPFSCDSGGYGKMWSDGKLVTVSRRLCEEVNGRPPTPKHDAAHSCGQGHEGCVTKGHLIWKTRKNNMADTLSHGTRNRGDRNGRAKITEAKVHEILSFKGKETQRSIADRLGISPSTVSGIHRGESWSWLQG